MSEPSAREGARTSTEDGWLERAFMGSARRLSGRTITVVSLVLYPGFGLALPLVLGWPTFWLVYANLIGVVFAALISLGWLVAQLEAANRRHLVEWTTDLRHLNSQEFEWFVGEVFRRDGWNIVETGRQDGPDGNVDLVLTRGRDRRLVQCKRWQSWRVDVNQIRAFAGTVSAEKKHAALGMFVTLSTFTQAAETEAKRLGIELIDGRELHALVERARRPELCPLCQEPMTLDRSPHGWWFRCKAQGCTGKRDLAGEPALAVDLLTQRPWISEAKSADVA